MRLNKKKNFIKKKYCLVFFLGVGLTILGGNAFAQSPPPPPPPPGELLNRINPFKKDKKPKNKPGTKDTAKVTPGPPAGGPPPPPNPMNLFKKKKRDTSKVTGPVRKSV